jgi:hypothetical protein
LRAVCKPLPMRVLLLSGVRGTSEGRAGTGT